MELSDDSILFLAAIFGKNREMTKYFVRFFANRHRKGADLLSMSDTYHLLSEIYQWFGE